MRVTVQYVNFPQRADAKFGNIKTSDGITIMVPVAQLMLYQKGMSCDVPTEQKTWGQGDAARPVTVAVGPPSQAGAAPNQEPQRGQAWPTAQQGSPHQPLPPGAQAASPGPPRGNPEARSIFATGVVGRAMGSGKFSASEINVLLEEALRTYDKNLGGG